MMIDLIARLGMPVVLAARSGLGTINHTLLSLEALRRRGIPVLGVVMSGPLSPGNREAIERFGDVRVLAEIRRWRGWTRLPWPSWRAASRRWPTAWRRWQAIWRAAPAAEPAAAPRRAGAQTARFNRRSAARASRARPARAARTAAARHAVLRKARQRRPWT